MSLVDNSVLNLLDSYIEQDYEESYDGQQKNDCDLESVVENTEDLLTKSKDISSFDYLKRIIKANISKDRGVQNKAKCDMVISSSREMQASMPEKKKSIFIVQQQPSGFKTEQDKDQISMNEICGDMATTPISFGNGLFGSKVLTECCYNNRCDPPRDPNDILYEGRMLGNKNKLNDCLLAIRDFGYVMVVEKSEAAKGRYKLVCERGSKKRKKLIADYDDTLCTRCFAYVNIHGFRVNVSQMNHSHGPGLILPEKHFMGLLHTERYSKAKEDYIKENKLQSYSYQKFPCEKTIKVSNLTENEQDSSMYNNLLLDDLNFNSTDFTSNNIATSIQKVKTEIPSTRSFLIMSKNPRFDRFRDKVLCGKTKLPNSCYQKVKMIIKHGRGSKENKNDKSNIFIRIDAGTNGYATPVNIGFTIQDWNNQCEDTLKEISRVRGVDYLSL